MAGKTLGFFNLTGGLNTVQDLATINSTTNRTESPEMFNVEYYKLSGIRTMNGNAQIGVGSIKEHSGETRITCGYEYTLGNDSSMIVTTQAGNIYEYNSYEDKFEKIASFGHASHKHSICGFNNGIVVCDINPNYNFMLYYKRGRSSQVTGIKVETTSNSNEITITTFPSAAYTASDELLAKGDLILLNDVEYEVSTVQSAYLSDGETINPDAAKFTVTTNVVTGTSDIALYFADVAKIYNTYTSKVYTNETATTYETTTTDFKATVVQSHQGRLWVGTESGLVFYSDLGNIHGWEGGDASAYDGGYFEQFYEDNSSITAIGTWDKYVVIHKREHTYLIDTSNSSTTNWNVESYSEYTCDNQLGFVKANNGYYVYAREAGGIYPMIQRTIYSAISQGAEASSKIRTVFDNLSRNRLDEIYAVYHPYKRYIMFYMPFVGYEGSNNCYILDLQTKSWLLRRIPQTVTTAFQFDSKVYIGTEDGKVLEEFTGVTFENQPIQFSWKSPWFIWGGSTNWTTSREFRLKMSQDGTNNFYLRNYRDGSDKYKQRNIVSKSNNTLMWDEGYLINDIDPEYQTQRNVYSYTVTIDGVQKTYYAFSDTIDKYSRVYETIPTSITLRNSIAAGAVWAKTEVVDPDEIAAGNYDVVEWGTGTIYAYKHSPTKPQYICYRSTRDSNIKAWVPDSDHTTATVNVKQTVTNKQVAWGYHNYYSPAEFDDAGNVICYASPEQLMNAGQYSCTASNVKVVVQNNGWNNSKVAWVCYYANGMWANLGHCLYWVNSSNPSRRQPTRNTSLDVYEQQTGEVWNGLTTRSGLNKTVSSFSSSSIVIDGVTYNRYSAGDEGVLPDGADVIKYSDKQTLVVGDTVYDDTALTTAYGNVTNVSGDNYTIRGDVFVPDSSNNEVGAGTKYYLVGCAFTFPETSSTVAGTVLANYQYPDDMDTDKTKRLTNTVWADGRDDATDIDPDLTEEPTTLGDKWVTAGQLTKRFPMDTQYFQTLQIEFCGDEFNQGLELYGFEVDGIQLTEVPW